LLTGALRKRRLTRFFSRGEPHPARSAPAWHRRPSSDSGGGPGSSRCGSPPPNTTEFNRGSFGPLFLAQHGTPQLAEPRRPLTSRAHRLGKPHQTLGPLTPSVTRRSPDSERSSFDPTAPQHDLTRAGEPASSGSALPRLV